MKHFPLVELADNVFQFPATKKPFSCDIVFIKTSERTWVFDVGCSKANADAINAMESECGNKTVVISHFHPDHILNLPRIKCDEVLVSKYTKKYTFRGTVVTENLHFDDGVSIIQMPSSHAKGCLVLTYGDFAFMGDGTYCKDKLGHHLYDANLLAQEIEVIKSLPCKYVCLSHDANFVQKKEDVLALHEKIYARRQKDESYISVDDFFNDDGSVKSDYTI